MNLILLAEASMTNYRLIFAFIIVVLFTYTCLFGQDRDTVIIKDATYVFIFSYESGKPKLVPIDLEDSSKIYIIFPRNKYYVKKVNTD